jgi:hypothetical protein
MTHPVDSRLLEIARHKDVSTAKRAGIEFKQTFAKEGKALRWKAGDYAHAKQSRRLRRVLKRQRTILGTCADCYAPLPVWAWGPVFASVAGSVLKATRHSKLIWHLGRSWMTSASNWIGNALVKNSIFGQTVQSAFLKSEFCMAVYKVQKRHGQLYCQFVSFRD